MCNNYYWFERESGSKRMVDLAVTFPPCQKSKESTELTDSNAED